MFSRHQNRRTRVRGTAAAFVVACAWALATALPAGASVAVGGQVFSAPFGVSDTTIAAVTCASETLCVTGDQTGHVMTSTNPAGGSSAWPRKPVSAYAITGVSCPSASLCVAVDHHGNVLTSTDPAHGSWSSPVPADAPGALTGVSCPSASLCVATDQNGDVGWSTNPTGDVSAWHFASVDVFILNGVACPSSHLCVAFDSLGNIFTSTDPTSGSWSFVTAPQSPPFTAMSCPSTSLCVAVDDGGRVITSTNPAGHTWSAPAQTDSTSLRGVSCPSVSYCLAVDPQGGILTTGDPTGGAGAWSAPTTIDTTGGTLVTIACPTVNLCVASDSTGYEMVGASLPTNTVPPFISGSPSPGSGVVCSPGTWTGLGPFTYGYQWLRDGTPITGATTALYFVARSDVGHQLACQVTATNVAGPEASVSATVEVQAGVVRLVSKGLVVSRAGHGSLKLSCSAGTCTGVFELDVTFVTKHRKHRRQHNATIAIAQFTVVSGTPATVTFKLTRLGRRLLRAHRGLLDVAVLLKAGQERPELYQVTLKLAVPHRKHKH